MHLTASAARSGTQIFDAIKSVSDHVTIEEILANMSSVVDNGDFVKTEALNCLNVITHGEYDFNGGYTAAMFCCLCAQNIRKISAPLTVFSTRAALLLPRLPPEPNRSHTRSRRREPRYCQALGPSDHTSHTAHKGPWCCARCMLFHSPDGLGTRPQCRC
jgi:hypothetical protein